MNSRLAVKLNLLNNAELAVFWYTNVRKFLRESPYFTEQGLIWLKFGRGFLNTKPQQVPKLFRNFVINAANNKP